MATRRPSRAGIFTGRTLGRRGRPHHVDPAAALLALGGVTYSWDLATDRLAWGPNACAILGLSPNALPATGDAFRSLVEPIGGLVPAEALAAGETSYDLRYALRVSADSAILIQDAGRSTMDGGGHPAFVRGFLRSDPLSRGQDILPRAINDRTALLRRLDNDIADASRFSHTVTLVVCEVIENDPTDRDDIIRLMRPIMRRRDHVTVLSGTRLAVVLTSCSRIDAPVAMKRLVDLLTADGRRIRVAAACAPDHALDACRLLRLAEESLDDATSHMAVKLHDPQYSPRRSTRRADPVDYIAALNDRRFALTVQPIVDAHTPCPTGGSPLVPTFARARMAIDRGAAISLLDATPEADISLFVDARQLELAADYLWEFRDDRIVMSIGVATLRDPEWLSVLAAHLGARPGIASRLIVGLPEAILVEKAKVLGRLDAMKALGIGLALDNFGSGYATHARLRSLPIDLVGIDSVFIQALNRSTGDRLFVRTLIDIAQHLGIATLADGVTDGSMAQMLGGWGVDYLTGDAFGPPTRVAAPVSVQPVAKRA